MRLAGVVPAIAWALGACRPAAETAPAPPTPPAPIRVVSLSPAASEFVIALGAADLLVAVDSESARLASLDRVPVASWADSIDLAPDLLLTPPLRGEERPFADRVRAGGGAVIEVAPHNFDDVSALYRTLGARLVGYASATALENRMGRELASTGGSFYGRVRPRIAAVISVEPLVVAGGHSFTTDLIELSGGNSVTHDLQEPRVPMSTAQLLATAPDLVLVVSASAPSVHEKEVALLALREVPRVDFFVFDAERFWIHDGVDAAQRMRTLLDPISRAMER